MVLWLTFINLADCFMRNTTMQFIIISTLFLTNPILILIIVTLYLSECAYISQVQLYLLLEFFNLIIMINFLTLKWKRLPYCKNVLLLNAIKLNIYIEWATKQPKNLRLMMWCVYQPVILSFWRHPFTAEDSESDVMHTFSKSVPMNKQTLQLNLQFKISIYILYDLRVSTALCFLTIEAAYRQIGAWMWLNLSNVVNVTVTITLACIYLWYNTYKYIYALKRCKTSGHKQMPIRQTTAGLHGCQSLSDPQEWLIAGEGWDRWLELIHCN